jgi:hypothetical protein
MTSALHPAISAAAAPVRQRHMTAARRCSEMAEGFEEIYDALRGCLCAVKRAQADAARRAAKHFRRLCREHLHIVTNLTDYRAPSDTNDTLAHNLARLAASCT